MPTLNGETVPFSGVLDARANGSQSAWGARLIVNQDGHVDFVPDRQGTAGENLNEFLNRLSDEFTLDQMKTEIRELLSMGKMSTRKAAEFLIHSSDAIRVYANTNGSGGYCYVIAVATFAKRPVDEVLTAGEATDLAIDWQHWAGEQSLSWGELADWQAYFGELADKFGLRAEFEENGIV